MIKLLGPEQARVGLAGDLELGRFQRICGIRACVELVGLSDASRENLFEICTKGLRRRFLFGIKAELQRHFLAGGNRVCDNGPRPWCLPFGVDRVCPPVDYVFVEGILDITAVVVSFEQFLAHSSRFP